MVTFRTPTTDTVKEKVRETRYISNKTEMSEGIQMLMNIDMIRDMANVKIREYGIGYDNAFKTARNEYFGLEPAVEVISEPFPGLSDIPNEQDISHLDIPSFDNNLPGFNEEAISISNNQNDSLEKTFQKIKTL